MITAHLINFIKIFQFPENLKHFGITEAYTLQICQGETSRLASLTLFFCLNS